MRTLAKVLTLFFSSLTLVVACYFCFQFRSLSAHTEERETASLHAEPAHGESHGAPADAHGGGHGDGHGGGHGGAPAPAPVMGSSSLVSLDEIFVNIGGPEGPVRSLGVRLELELFSESDRNYLDQRQPGIRHSVIQASREQNFSKLGTMQGKLYFKEQLVARINAFLGTPAVKEVHFSSFYLQ